MGTILTFAISAMLFAPSVEASGQPIPFVHHPWDVRTQQYRSLKKHAKRHAYPYYVKGHLYAAPFRSQTHGLHPVHRRLYTQGYVGGYLWNYHGNQPATFSQAGHFGQVPRSAVRNPVEGCQNYGYIHETWRVPYGYRCS